MLYKVFTLFYIFIIGISNIRMCFKLLIVSNVHDVQSVWNNDKHWHSTVHSFRMYPLCKKHTHSLHWTIVSITCNTHIFPCAPLCSQSRYLWCYIWHTQIWVKPCVALYLLQNVHCDCLHPLISVLGTPGLHFVDGNDLVRNCLTGQL